MNYGKYLAVVKNSQDEFEIYWAAYIKEYIEEVAREKLDMYLPNEKVYIDKNN